MKVEARQCVKEEAALETDLPAVFQQNLAGTKSPLSALPHQTDVCLSL
jgi:hypothetical protein